MDRHHGALVVEAHPDGIYIRPSGSRSLVGPVSWGYVYLSGAKMRAEEIRKERRARRRSRR